MTQGLLRIYVEGKDGNVVDFPLNEEQAIVEDWTRTAERMAGAPSVTGTVMHKLCLDNLWTKKEFVVIGGERYYVKQVPTSSKDTEDVRYKHDVTLVSERDIHENVYFFDVVTKREDAQAGDKPRSNTTDFSFYGDLNELVERLNDSLAYSKIYDAKGVNGFCIVIDDDVEIGEAQEVSITDAYFATAMQEIYNVFKVPYYWVGKVCHVGYAQNEIEKPFEYGKDNGLLSVSKNNSEYRLINRITGMGSADNIPYYYPNTDPNGEPILTIKNMDRANIKSIQLTTINAKFGGSVGKTFCLGNIKEENATTELFNDDKTLNGIAKYAAPYIDEDEGGNYYTEDPVVSQEEQLPMILEFEFYAYVNDEIDASNLSINTSYEISGATTTIDFNKGSQSNWGQTCSPPIEGWDAEAKIIMPDGYEEIITANDKTYRCKKQGVHKLIINCTPLYRVSMHPASKPDELAWATIDWYCHINGSIKFKTFYGDVIYQSGRVFKIEESGISIIGDNLPKLDLALQPNQDYGSFSAHIIGGSIATCAQFTITGIDFINPISKLMPYVYREQKGAERFYNALNNKYLKENGEYYSFNNPYLPNEPLEGKQDFEDIKPTINGITNAQGQLFGEVADIAFDETDSDDLAIEEGDTNSAKLVHSYFYIKLHKFDGDYGFNLFKQGLSKGAMTLNFISGSCAGCAFEVHVADEKKQVDNHYEFTNPVQVDEDGNIVAGDFDDKIKNNPIASQQDTINNEVWVALLKDQSTFGVVMPNATNDYKPKAGDKFVITNILLPQVYITAAEKRLEAALIKYMSENNDEKFTFSIKFSRIYLQKHLEDIVPYLNENARINVKYNNTIYPLYVSSYTQKYDGNILDEISVELSEELTITQNKSKQQMDSILGNVNSGISESITISSTELLNQVQLLLDKKLSKTDNDSASGIITFLVGFNFANTLLTSLVKSTDWRKIMDDSQLVTGGGMARYVENIMANLAEKYLRRDIDDEAKGLITFLKGLKSDDLATFMSGMEVAGLAMFKSTVLSELFTSGWSGYGWRLFMKEAMNVVGSLTKRSELEVDDLVVRGSLKAFEFVINQLRGENDNFVFAGMQKVLSVDETNKTIYLDSNNGETYCPFTKGDILRCQRFQTGGTIIKQYDILVKEAHIGSLSDGENRIDSIVWETFSGDVADIAQGDVLCRLDSNDNPERKGIITTTSVGSNSPYIDVIYGLITNPEESLKVRLGKLDGIVNSLFGELSGYGLYSNNAFLTGEFFLSTGEAVATKIKMLENLFSSSMSKTTYDIKEDDNIVQNCAFADDMRGWTTVDGDDMDFFFIDDDTPVFMNDDMFSDSHSVAAMENMQGKEMLHLLNAGVTQANALFVGRVPEDSEVEEYVKDAEGNIIKNEDGTLKTKTKTIRPTIYISYRYMCKESGSLSIGFNNGRTTQYSSDMGVIVSVDELGTLTESVNANEGVWIERQYKGYYDKLGDFVISTTGEVYIDVLAVTSKPLDDYKNVVSTALVQTAGAIGLYGKNIRANEESIHGVGQSVTELGVVVDTNKREVDLFVNTTYANDKAGLETKIENGIKVSTEGIEAVASRTTTLEKDTAQLKIDYNSISSTVANARGDISNLQQTAKDITSRVGNAENDITSVTQTANEVRTEVTNARGSYASLSLALDGIKSSVYTKSDIDGKVNTLNSRIDQKADSVTLEVYAKSETVQGYVAVLNSKIDLKQDKIDLSVYAKTTYVDSETGEIKTGLQKSGIDIEAHQITISSTAGKLVVDTTNFKLDASGNVDITGKITAEEGKIGGFLITESTIQTVATSADHRPIIGLSSSGLLLAQNAEITGKVTATSGTFDNCTINESCNISGKLVSVHGQFGAWVLGDNGGYDLTCEQTVDTMFIMTNTRHKALRNVRIRTTNGNSKYFGDSVTDNASQLYVQTDDGTCAEFNVWYAGGTALRLIAPSGATALYVGGLSKFSGNVSMSLSTTIPTISGYLYRDSNGFVKIKI